MQFTYKVLFLVLHILIAPLTITLLSLFILYKLLICALASVFKRFACSIPSSSYMFISDSISQKPNASIVVALQLQENCTQGDIAQIFQNVYDLRDKNGKSERVHILQNVEALSEVEDANANDNHKNTESSLSAVLPSIVENVQRQPYGREQPLWDVYLLSHDDKNKSGNLVIFRFHHLLADGMSVVKLFYALSGTKKLPETFTRPSSSVERWDQLTRSSVVTKMLAFVSLITVGLVESLHQVFFEKDINPLNFNEEGQIKGTGDWICTMGRKIDVDKLKVASRHYRCSIVHIILAGISSGVDKYFLNYHGNETLPEGYHFIAPLPLPGHPNLRIVNHWCLSKIHSRMGIKWTTEEKLAYFAEETKRCATASFPIASTFLLKFIAGLIPSALMELVYGSTAAIGTVCLSNVVGPQVQDRFVSGSTVVDMMFWLPLMQDIMGIGLSVGTISFDRGLRVCLTADRGCIPYRSQLETLVNMIDEELVDICKFEE